MGEKAGCCFSIHRLFVAHRIALGRALGLEAEPQWHMAQEREEDAE